MKTTVRSTATLACVGRLQDYFRDEFLTTMEILQRGDVRPELLKGSWAGAFGGTQFMPTSFKRFAIGLLLLFRRQTLSHRVVLLE